MLSLPTGSLKEFTRYIQRLLSKGQRSANVVTKFSLKKELNKKGAPYSQVQFTLARSVLEQGLLGDLHYGEIDYYHGIGPWYGQFPYEKLKEVTRGQAVTAEALHGLIRSLDIPPAEKDRLLALTPASYTGMAADLARRV